MSLAEIKQLATQLPPEELTTLTAFSQTAPFFRLARASDR
jgi:hypothetical protein